MSRYHIDWNDGKADDVSNFPFVHTYGKPGNYLISVTDYDSNGLNNNRNVPIEISSTPNDNKAPDLNLGGWAGILTALAAVIGGVVALLKLFVKRKPDSAKDMFSIPIESKLFIICTYISGHNYHLYTVHIQCPWMLVLLILILVLILLTLICFLTFCL